MLYQIEISIKPYVTYNDFFKNKEGKDAYILKVANNTQSEISNGIIPEVIVTKISKDDYETFLNCIQKAIKEDKE